MLHVVWLLPTGRMLLSTRYSQILLCLTMLSVGICSIRDRSSPSHLSQCFALGRREFIFTKFRRKYLLVCSICQTFRVPCMPVPVASTRLRFFAESRSSQFFSDRLCHAEIIRSTSYSHDSLLWKLTTWVNFKLKYFFSFLKDSFCLIPLRGIHKYADWFLPL